MPHCARRGHLVAMPHGFCQNRVRFDRTTPVWGLQEVNRMKARTFPVIAAALMLATTMSVGCKSNDSAATRAEQAATRAEDAARRAEAAASRVEAAAQRAEAAAAKAEALFSKHL